MTTSKTWRLRIANTDGQPLCTVLVTRERPEGTGASTAPADPARRIESSPSNGGQLAEGPRMTEPQRRYLFRLLAEDGLDAAAAEAQLKQIFQVTSLRQVSRTAASERIDQLVTERKEASDDRA